MTDWDGRLISEVNDDLDDKENAKKEKSHAKKIVNGVSYA